MSEYRPALISAHYRNPSHRSGDRSGYRSNSGLDWPRSGPVRTVAFFGDRLKRLDRTVQHLRTAVRSQKYWTGPFSPVFLLFQNGD